MLGSFRRILASVAAWTLGAGIAVGVGVISLSLIDNGLASGAGRPMSTGGSPRPASGAAAVTGSDDPSPGPVPDSPRPPSPSPSARSAASPTPGPPRQFTSTGGTVLARCTGNVAYLVSWSPAQDYRADDVHRGPARTVWVKFENGTQFVVLAVHCLAGMPQPISYWDE